jgi:hypothetical protein
MHASMVSESTCDVAPALPDCQRSASESGRLMSDQAAFCHCPRRGPGQDPLAEVSSGLLLRPHATSSARACCESWSGLGCAEIVQTGLRRRARFDLLDDKLRIVSATSFCAALPVKSASVGCRRL